MFVACSFPLPFTSAETMPARSIESNTFSSPTPRAVNGSRWVYQTRVRAWLRVNVQIRRNIIAGDVVRVEGD